jgi:hypothetical protein
VAAVQKPISREVFHLILVVAVAAVHTPTLLLVRELLDRHAKVMTAVRV